MLRGRRVALVAAFLFITLLCGKSALAQYGQYGAYGAAAPAKSIVIEKVIKTPGTSSFVDNLSQTDPRFHSGDTVTFKLTVRNTSDVALNGVVVKDFVPDFLSPAGMGGGTFTPNDRIVTFNVGDLQPNEARTYTLLFKVSSQDQLPADQGVICEINRAQATAEDLSDEDTSQFCIEKQVTVVGPGAVTTVPSTGPEMGLLLFSSEVALLGLGVAIKKFTK